jgi:RNase H-fold protein (predicted Holliday junction resolvase)
MKFLLLFSLSTITFLGFFMGLVTSVDPYSKLGNNPWGFKTKAVAQSRENKFILLENSKNKYEAFIFGSSAAHRFPTSKVKELTGLHTFNYAAQHTNPDDYLAMVRHAFDKHAPKLILLQIGFVEMSETYKTDNRLFNSSLLKYLREIKREDTFFENNYFTLDAIRDSFRVIFVNNFGKALHSNYVEHGDYKFEKLNKGAVKVQQSSYPNWRLSKERIAVIKEIQKICNDNGTRLIVFTAPLSYEHYKVAKATKGHNDFIKYLRTHFKESWTFHKESIKSFSTYKEFHNSTHMTKEFSATLLERMLGNSQVELGEKISDFK